MLTIDLQSRQPIYEQLIYRMSELVALGALAPGEQLPSVRALARDLGINPNTVQKAYQELERRGVICSVAGKGSFIAGGDSAGDSAGETLRMRSLEKIRDALESGRRAGVSRAQALETVEYVYKEANV